MPDKSASKATTTEYKDTVKADGNTSPKQVENTTEQVENTTEQVENTTEPGGRHQINTNLNTTPDCTMNQHTTGGGTEDAWSYGDLLERSNMYNLKNLSNSQPPDPRPPTPKRLNREALPSAVWNAPKPTDANPTPATASRLSQPASKQIYTPKMKQTTDRQTAPSNPQNPPSLATADITATAQLVRRQSQSGPRRREGEEGEEGLQQSKGEREQGK
ncbi:hypothetical protein QQ045_008078 [Rhodiola kirilowii]